MKYSEEALKRKILEMYPEIPGHKIAVSVSYNENKGAYLLKFRRGSGELLTQIDKMDADDCMNNIQCIHLGVKVDQFVRNFEAREVFSRRVA